MDSFDVYQKSVWRPLARIRKHFIRNRKDVGSVSIRIKKWKMEYIKDVFTIPGLGLRENKRPENIPMLLGFKIKEI